MALNIKNAEVEGLAAEIAKMTGESKTEAVRRALLERRERLAFQVNRRDQREELLEFLEQEVWPNVPAGELGKTLTKEQEEALLGYGPMGV